MAIIKNLSIKHKQIAIFIIFFIFVLVLIISNIVGLNTIQGDAKQINDAGSLRMRTYRIILLTDRYISTGNEAFKKQVGNDIKVYNEILENLKKEYKTQKEIYDDLLSIEKGWESINQKINLLLERKAYGELDINSLTIEGNDLVNTLIHGVVAKIQEYSDGKIGIQIALLIIMLILAAALLILFSILMPRVVTKPIVQMMELMGKAEDGDLTVRGTVYFNDEMGKLTESFNQFIENIRKMIKDISETTTVLNNSSDGLLQVANAIAAASEVNSAKTSLVNVSVENITMSIDETADTIADSSSSMNVIASAVEEMSGTVRNLATASEQTSEGVQQIAGLMDQTSKNINNVSRSARSVSDSVNSVATAVKEINISFNQISNNCERSISITSDADHKVKDTNEMIGKLSDSSKEIGKIVKVINKIADQTNMLALNAAIEAAGAGEAGKGFAVVANEVKELAKQTAEATDEIRNQIDSMHENMVGAEKAVEAITGVISEIASITNTIAAAVTEQSATTGDISKSIVRAAEKVNSITKEIEEIALGSKDAARNALEASRGVSEIARSASELSIASNEVAKNTESVTTKLHEVAETSKGIAGDANEISKNMKEINKAAVDEAVSVTETTNSASTLTEVAQKLGVLVKQFKV